MENLQKGKYTIVVRHLSGKTEIYQTNEFWYTENNTNLNFEDLNDSNAASKGKRFSTFICKIEGIETPAKEVF